MNSAVTALTKNNLGAGSKYVLDGLIASPTVNQLKSCLLYAFEGSVVHCAKVYIESATDEADKEFSMSERIHASHLPPLPQLIQYTDKVVVQTEDQKKVLCHYFYSSQRNERFV